MLDCIARVLDPALGLTFPDEDREAAAVGGLTNVRRGEYDPFAGQEATYDPFR